MDLNDLKTVDFYVRFYNGMRLQKIVKVIIINH